MEDAKTINDTTTEIQVGLEIMRVKVQISKNKNS